MGRTYDTANRRGGLVTFDNWDVYASECADLIEMKPLAGVVSASYAKIAGLSAYRLYHQDIPLRTLEMSFYVGGDTAADTEKNVSELLYHAKECVIRTEFTPFEYPAILTGYTDTDTGVEFFHKVVLKFAALKRLPMVTTTVSDEGINYVENEGTGDSGLKMELTFDSSHDSVDVNFMTLRNVTAGVPFIIDGIGYTIQSNGENRLDDVDLYDFPRIGHGMNPIQLPSGCTCKLSYYPTFL